MENNFWKALVLSCTAATETSLGIYSIAFTVSLFTGFMGTAGIVLHEFPEEIITYLLLMRVDLVGVLQSISLFLPLHLARL